ncbi:BnaCnng50820D [Brassica napus]|uniref:BnaCnng50820D protein n=1 Tax=Brassica napus TaxID=3708 RepID=A0A078JFQ1_BRANA|nr:BnaCnng50820D [Brassica napus]
MKEEVKKHVDHRYDKLDTIVSRNDVPASERPQPLAMPSPRSKRKDEKLDDVEMSEIHGNLHNVSVSQSSNIDLEMDTQDYLWKTMGNLIQDSYVKGFDPSQKAKVDDPMEWLTLLTSLNPKETPLTSFKPKETSLPFLRDRDLPDDRVKDKDYSLVFVPEESWVKLVEWSLTSMELQIGPSMFTKEMSARIVGPTEWLENYRTTLGRWKANKVAFMSCVFSNQMKCSYATFEKDKTKFKVEGLLHDYGTGQLPPHGRTGLVWDVDVSRMYVPVFVHAEKKKHLNVVKYKVVYVPVPFINKSSSDCGVYALKFIECHALGLDFTLVNDDNIHEARHNIAYDLWEAANNPELMLRMSKYTPPKTITSDILDMTSQRRSIDGIPSRWLKRKKEDHLFKWVDEAMFDELRRVDAQQALIEEEIDDLKKCLKKTEERVDVEKAILSHR